MRKVLYLTGTRADFGLMASTLARIAAHPGLSLQLTVTGMHLSEACGLTVREVEATGLPIVARIPTAVDERSTDAMALGIAQTLQGLTPVLRAQRPDIVLVLGDRYEKTVGGLDAEVEALSVKVAAHLAAMGVDA